ASIGRPDLADDPRFGSNAARVENRAALDALIEEWTRSRTLDEALDAFERHEAAAAPVSDIAQIFDDPQYRARGTIARIPDPALARADPSLEVRLFHSRFPPGAPPAGLPRGVPVVGLEHDIRRLYPSWALLGRPPLPASLSGARIVHAPVPAAVPPVGPDQRLVVTVHDVAFLARPETFPLAWRIMYRA